MANHDYTRPGGTWTDVADTLNETDLEDFETKMVQAPNFTGGGTYAPSSIINVFGSGISGRIAHKTAIATDSDRSYAMSDAVTLVKMTSAMTADRVYTLSATGAADGDVISFWAAPSCVQAGTIKFGSTTLWIVGRAQTDSSASSPWAQFIYDGATSAWRLLSRAPYQGFRYERLTSSGNFTVPLDCYALFVTLLGGGGGGGGGANGFTNANEYPKGGAGGGAAVPVRAKLSVTPGQVIAFTRGDGGAGGFAGFPGADGGTSAFGSLYAPGGGGGAGGGSTTGETRITHGGTSGAGGRGEADRYTYAPIQMGQGGYGSANSFFTDVNGAWGFGNTGGFGGNGGANDGSWRGGGGGGGGAAGPRGVGADGGDGGAGVSGGAGVAGTAGTAGTLSSGAGGGGGGAGGSGSSGGAGGVGGAGGSGAVEIEW